MKHALEIDPDLASMQRMMAQALRSPAPIAESQEASALAERALSGNERLTATSSSSCVTWTSSGKTSAPSSTSSVTKRS
jgi:hypothetical protein